MSEYKELPDPPGGSITCEDGQFCLVETDDDGQIHASCTTILPVSGGSPSGSKIDPNAVESVGADFKKLSSLIEMHRMELNIGKNRGVVRVNDRDIPLYQFDKGLRLVTGVDKLFGGLKLPKAVSVSQEEYFERPDGIKVWFSFPGSTDRKEPEPLKYTNAIG